MTRLRTILRRRPRGAGAGGLRDLPLADAVFWAVDLEMSGLDPARDRIVAAGAVPVRGWAIPVGEAWSSLVCPDGPVGAEAIAVHHLLPDRLEGAPPLADVLAELDRRLAGAVLVVHHASVDVAFLDAARGRLGLEPLEVPVVDTARLWLRQERHRLATGAVRAGLAEIRAELGLPPHEAHDALADALATAEIFLVLAERLKAVTVGDLALRG